MRSASAFTSTRDDTGSLTPRPTPPPEPPTPTATELQRRPDATMSAASKSFSTVFKALPSIRSVSRSTRELAPRARRNQPEARRLRSLCARCRKIVRPEPGVQRHALDRHRAGCLARGEVLLVECEQHTADLPEVGVVGLELRRVFRRGQHALAHEDVVRRRIDVGPQRTPLADGYF